jgi:hypothetical protein
MLHPKLVRHHSLVFVKIITTVISFQSLWSHQWHHKSIDTSLDYQQRCHYKTVMTLERSDAALNYFSALTFVNRTDGVTSQRLRGVNPREFSNWGEQGTRLGRTK